MAFEYVVHKIKLLVIKSMRFMKAVRRFNMFAIIAAQKYQV